MSGIKGHSNTANDRELGEEMRKLQSKEEGALKTFLGGNQSWSKMMERN